MSADFFRFADQVDWVEDFSLWAVDLSWSSVKALPEGPAVSFVLEDTVLNAGVLFLGFIFFWNFSAWATWLSISTVGDIPAVGAGPASLVLEETSRAIQSDITALGAHRVIVDVAVRASSDFEPLTLSWSLSGGCWFGGGGGCWNACFVSQILVPSVLGKVFPSGANASVKGRILPSGSIPVVIPP